MRETPRKNKLIRLRINNAPDIQFIGQKIVSIRTQEGYGDCRETWDIYHLESGKYMCYRITHTLGCDYSQYMLATTPDDIIKFFGYSDAAKSMYKQISKNYNMCLGYVTNIK